MAATVIAYADKELGRASLLPDEKKLTFQNANEIKDAVNDNAALTDTNTSGVATNVADIATNVTNIGTNTTNIGTNTTDIGTNTTDIGTNVTDIANRIEKNVGATYTTNAITTLTQVEYDALTPVATTLYFIV